VKVLDELVSNVDESPDGSMLFYSRPRSKMVHAAEGIWRRPVNGGTEKFIVAFSGTWSVGPDGLYLSKGTKIDRYSYSGKLLNTVARNGKFWMFDPLSISPDGRSAIFCHRLHDSVEIEMVPGFN
jgi:hypothetical protein